MRRGPEVDTVVALSEEDREVLGMAVTSTLERCRSLAARARAAGYSSEEQRFVGYVEILERVGVALKLATRVDFRAAYRGAELRAALATNPERAALRAVGR